MSAFIELSPLFCLADERRPRVSRRRDASQAIPRQNTCTGSHFATSIKRIAHRLVARLRDRANVLDVRYRHCRQYRARAGNSFRKAATLAMFSSVNPWFSPPYWPQAMYWPPLTENVAPVMNEARSSTRKAAIRAISSALPSRPAGICATICAMTSDAIFATMSVLQ